jgi:hypothetical protein
MHVMIDLETFGTRPGCVLRSIGACAFDPVLGTISTDTFYRNIAEEPSTAVGLTKDPSTVRWWSEQSPEAQALLLKDQVHFSDAARDFNRWWSAVGGEQVWSQGSNFDGVLWEAACLAHGVRAPWKFYNTRDTRTVYETSGLNTKTILRQGTHHNALDDALHQARCVCESFARLRRAS